MRSRLGTALAVGAAVVAELALGAFLVVTGGGNPGTANPWRVGDGFPQPPLCSMINHLLVATLLGGDGGIGVEQSYYREDDDPTRRCVFTAPRSRGRTVEVTMRSRLGNHGALEIPAPGLSQLTVHDNLSTEEIKRYGDQVAVGFHVDNLMVGIYHSRPSGPQTLPDQETALRIREDVMALVRDISGKLTPRNRTSPTSTR